MLYLVAYDIADDTRRNRVAHTLLDYGVRVQESVFECLIDSDVKRDELVGRLRDHVAQDADSVRVIPVCANCADKLTIIGRGKPTEDPEVYVI